MRRLFQDEFARLPDTAFAAAADDKEGGEEGAGDAGAPAAAPAAAAADDDEQGDLQGGLPANVQASILEDKPLPPHRHRDRARRLRSGTVGKTLTAEYGRLVHRLQCALRGLEIRKRLSELCEAGDSMIATGCQGDAAIVRSLLRGEPPRPGTPLADWRVEEQTCMLVARRVTATETQADRHMAATLEDPSLGMWDVQRRALQASPADGLAWTGGDPAKHAHLVPLAHSDPTTHCHCVRLREGELIPPHFEEDSVVLFEAGHSPLEDAEGLLEGRVSHAKALQSIHEVGIDATHVRGVVTACACLATCTRLRLRDNSTLRLTRAELYTMQHDGASMKLHVDAVQADVNVGYPPGSLFFQFYSGGFGWGLCVRLPAGAVVLVRATDDEGADNERGMTQTAKLVARSLGIEHELAPAVTSTSRPTSPMLRPISASASSWSTTGSDNRCRQRSRAVGSRAVAHSDACTVSDTLLVKTTTAKAAPPERLTHGSNDSAGNLLASIA